MRLTHPKDGENMSVDIESALVNASGESMIETLGEPLRNDEFMRDLFKLHVRLECLSKKRTVSTESKKWERRTLSSLVRNAIKSAHSCTLSKVWRQRSTCVVYFLNLGSAFSLAARLAAHVYQYQLE